MKLVDIPENPIPPGAELQAVQVGRLQLRTARWAARKADAASRPGTVVICQGRGEYIEKYAETVDELLDRGFAVVAFDWRGQGGSSRLLRNPRKGHVASFDHYHRDLDAVLTQILQPNCPKPWFALAHSMGGAILIDYAGRQNSAFDRIVLSAPMIAVYGLSMPKAVRCMAAVATVLGLGSFYVPGGGNESLAIDRFERNPLTTDPARFSVITALSRAAPELTLGAPTQAWLHAAFRIMARFVDPAYPRQIVTPILAVGCGDDRVVSTRAIERFAARLKAGCLLVFPHARHEILMESDLLRQQFWAAFDAFIPGTHMPQEPSPLSAD